MHIENKMHVQYKDALAKGVISVYTSSYLSISSHLFEKSNRDIPFTPQALFFFSQLNQIFVSPSLSIIFIACSYSSLQFIFAHLNLGN